MFRRIKGQEQPVELLSKAIENDRIAQAYLFHGCDGIGKFMSALYFGMAVNCVAINQLKPCGICPSCHKFLNLEHPDFVYIFPTPNLELSLDGEIKKAEARKQYEEYLQNKIKSPWQEFFFKESTEIRKENISYLAKRLELSIHEAKYRIVIIENADLMNQATANAFLKTLEEPPPNTIIMLITERLQMILPTILSRTQPIFFRPLTRRVIEDILIDQFEIGETTAKTAAKISAGNLKTAIRIASESDSIIRNWAFDILDKADKQDDLGFGTLLDKYKEQQKKDQISDLLKYVRILAADITELVMNPESDITNVDRLEYLQNTANNSKLSEDKLYDFLLFLEDLNRKIQGNANLGLVMINLYIRLKNLLHGTA